jgi:adenylate cyclase
MNADDFKRRLAAILTADVVGYSRLMAEDEVSTVRTLTAYRSEITTLVRAHNGRVVDFVGDNMLAEFMSALDAVDCAVQIQRALKHHNTKLDPERRMDFRIGLHLGDIMVDGERIYGDGVNVAARLEGLAEPGGICISDMVCKQVRKKLDLGYVELGERAIKNIPEPVRVYRIVEPSAAPMLHTDKAAPSAEAPMPLPDKPSLAVLPFVNLSADPEQDYFCDGLTLDIMTALVKISGLFLIGEHSMFTYKSKPVTTNELGRQLGVRHVLEGGVRKVGDRVRITTQLIEASSGRRVWAERFDRQLDDLFGVQDEITEEIVTALDVQLVSGEEARLIRKTLRTPAALECFYRGRNALFGSTKADVEEAQHMFEETIRLEPEVPLGYAMAAWAHWLAAFRGLSDAFSLSLERATELARKALSLKDATGFPHLIMAQIHLLKREHDQALAEADRAVFMRPSCNASYATKATILNYLGRPSEAIDLAKSAIRLTPVYPALYPAILARAYYACGRNEEAITAAEEVLKRDRDNLDGLLVLAAASATLGRMEEALRATQEVLRVKSGFSLEEFAKSQPYKDPRTFESVIAMLRKAGLK